MVKPRILQQNRKETKVGQKPGYLYVRENAVQTRLYLISFDEVDFAEQEFLDYDELYKFMQERPHQRH